MKKLKKILAAGLAAIVLSIPACNKKNTEHLWVHNPYVKCQDKYCDKFVVAEGIYTEENFKRIKSLYGIAQEIEKEHGIESEAMTRFLDAHPDITMDFETYLKSPKGKELPRPATNSRFRPGPVFENAFRR